MAKIVTAQTEMAQWYELVQEAIKESHCTLDEEVEGYLVLMLMRYARQPEMAGRVMAMEYLHALLAGGSVGSEQFRAVGDQCLLYSGLFPKRAQKRLVKVRYYIDLGRSSYHQVAEGLQKNSAQLYMRLARYFVQLMEVLHSMRGFDRNYCLEPRLLHELWDECGSGQALQQLEQRYNLTPVRSAGRNDKMH